MNSKNSHLEQLNVTMRIISGTLKAKNLSWLPVLCNIAPPELRRTNIVKHMNNSCLFYEKSLLFEIINDNVTDRLISRKPIWKILDELQNFKLNSGALLDQIAFRLMVKLLSTQIRNCLEWIKKGNIGSH